MGLCSLPGNFFGLRQPSPWVCGLYGQVSDDLQEGLHQSQPSQTAAASPMHLPPPPSLWGAPANLHLHSGPSNTTRWFWSSFLWSHFSFPLSLSACKVLFSPSKTGVSGPPVLWKFCNQIPLAFKVRFPGESQSFCQVSRLGSLTWGSKPSQQWENFFGVIVLQFVGHPPRGYGI